MKTEVQDKADFSRIRYAMCWEDADLLVAALAPKDRRCLSIGSAGDNSFSLLAAGAAHVTAVEMNPSQIACIELRKAAYLALDYQEFLQLLGVREASADQRERMFVKCQAHMPEETIRFWQLQENAWRDGIIGLGKFENYFRLFRSRALPLAHGKKRVMQLLESRNREERLAFYETVWNHRRWRWLFQVFFSRFVMGRLGRDPAFFAYVEGSVADRILQRVRHALVELEPADNPYLRMILCGTFANALPHAWREESFAAIKTALQENRFRVVQAPLEALLAAEPDTRYDAFNLSDIFEYMSEAKTEELLRQIVMGSNPGARLAYWNMLAPRSRPEAMADVIAPLPELSSALFFQDKAFFYSRFVIEEVGR